MRNSSLKNFCIRICESLYAIHQHLKFLMYTRLLHRLKVMSPEETISYILEHRCSIARYGDGEFSQMLHKYNIGFQRHDPTLAKMLEDSLTSPTKDLLICIPGSMRSVRKLNENAKIFWTRWGKQWDHQIRITKLLRKHCGAQYRYGDALITRPYMDLNSKKGVQHTFTLVKQLWKEKDLLIVEGQTTRMGIGNDLFAGARSIQRIICPAKDAFDSYTDIYNAVGKYSKGRLVLLALGPTATVLARALSQKGIQTLDMGHIDIEYEWYLRSATKKIPIPGKFTNEFSSKLPISPCEDPEYSNQIVYTCHSVNQM